MRSGDVYFHVDGVIELDRAGIRESRAQGRELRMA